MRKEKKGPPFANTKKERGENACTFTSSDKKKKGKGSRFINEKGAGALKQKEFSRKVIIRTQEKFEEALNGKKKRRQLVADQEKKGIGPLHRGKSVYGKKRGFLGSFFLRGKESHKDMSARGRGEERENVSYRYSELSNKKERRKNGVLRTTLEQRREPPAGSG